MQSSVTGGFFLCCQCFRHCHPCCCVIQVQLPTGAKVVIKLAGDFLNIVMQAAAADFANTEGVYIHVKVVLFILLPEKNGTISEVLCMVRRECSEHACMWGTKSVVDVSGLCGSFDGDSDNDLMVDGSAVTDTDHFSLSWRSVHCHTSWALGSYLSLGVFVFCCVSGIQWNPSF